MGLIKRAVMIRGRVTANLRIRVCKEEILVYLRPNREIVQLPPRIG